MKKVIMVLVAVAVLVLGYLLIMSIVRPVQFDRKQTQREQTIQKKLKAIATLEQAYRDVYGKYADERRLQWFLQEGKLYIVNAVGDYTDAMREQKISEREAAHRGLIQRDTTWIAVRDTLFVDSDITAANIFDVPGRKGEKIKLEIGTVDQIIGVDTIKASVFEASVLYTQYLKDLDPVRLQQKINTAEKRTNGFPGLRIGSLNEVKTTGNWE